MGVSELSQSFFWIDLVPGVERNEERLGAVQPLKNIHTVGDQGQVLIAAFSGEKVPAGPGEFALGMKLSSVWRIDAVFLVAHGAQYLLLQITRILQQLQRFVTVTGQYHFVKAFSARTGRDAYRGFVTGHRMDRGAQPDAICEAGCHRFDVAVRPAFQYIPLRTVLDVEQTMIQKEPEKKAERELTCLSNTAGPDGCNHRQQIVFPQTAAQALRLKKLIQSDVGCITRCNRQLAGLVESENVGYQADNLGLTRLIL